MSKALRINILAPVLAPHDAIGTDVAQMRVALIESGYEVRIFAEEIHPTFAQYAENIDFASPELTGPTRSILMYHHSMGWPRGEELLLKTTNKVILRYHNITPPHYFAGYSPGHLEACKAGIGSNGRIAKIPNALVLGDSSFNCDDLVAYGADRSNCRTLAPFHLTEELGRERFDFATWRKYSGTTVNILFVGSIKPNKAHARAIRAFGEYQGEYDRKSRLIFAGGIDRRLSNYIDDLRDLARQLGVGNSVIFPGPISASELKSLYILADVFLCTSEHEGFCVPLVEAMFFRVPILAWGVTAVPETVGTCGVLLNKWSDSDFAGQINNIVSDDEWAHHLGSEGRRRYRERFAPEVLRRELCSILTEVAQ